MAHRIRVVEGWCVDGNIVALDGFSRVEFMPLYKSEAKAKGFGIDTPKVVYKKVRVTYEIL